MLTLNSPWFELVRDGKKVYEGRRQTPKMMGLKCGDTITIHHHIDKKQAPYNVVVEDVIPFATFKHALEALPIEEVLPIENITVSEGVSIYHKYVSQATQEKDGVVMIKIRATLRHKQLLNKKEFDYDDRMIAMEAAEHGDVHILNHLAKHNMQFYGSMLDKAIIGGHIECADIILKQSHFIISGFAAEQLVKNQMFHELLYLMKKNAICAYHKDRILTEVLELLTQL